METVKLDRQGRVAVVTLNRPEKLNAITTQMLDGLDIALTDVEESDARDGVYAGLVITMRASPL